MQLGVGKLVATSSKEFLMKAVFDEETHYYKYVYNEWTQPTLTSNGTFGGDSMATSISYGSHVYDGGYNA